MPRLFVALPVSEEVADRLDGLKNGLPGARWIDRQDYHITLRFIGQVDGGVAREISAALAEISAEPIPITFDGFGAFGKDKPRNVHAVVRSTFELISVQRAVEQVMREAGMKPEPRKYAPHVTLARLSGGTSANTAAYLGQIGEVQLDSYRADQMVLYSAGDGGGGGPYVAEVVYPLA